MKHPRIAAAIIVLLGCALTAEAQGTIEVLENVAYLENAGYADDRDKLDLYLPAGVDGFPMVLVLHGGGLYGGDKEGSEPIGRRLAAEGIGVAVTNYRLWPARHPDHIEDAAAAFAWLHANASEHGGDPDQLFVLGHSAGGYLTALLAVDERYLGAHGLALSAIRGAVPVSGFYWLDEVAPVRLDRPVWGTDAAGWADASPASHLDSPVVPTLLLVADGDDDWRKAQITRYEAALGEAGLEDVRRVEIGDRTHTGIWSGIGEAGDQATTAIVAFIRRLTSAS